MAILSPSPKLQFFDANGNPLVGGKLYSYAAGTTTPLATYTDATQVSANPNPIILDSRGEAGVWLGSEVYKLVLYSATDVLIWSVDNVNSTTSGAETGIHNRIINGDMRVAQRGTSGALTTGYEYLSVDRFAAAQATAANGIFAQVAAGLTGFQSAAKLGRNAASTGTGVIQVRTALETVNSVPLQGQQVTLSFYAKAGTNFSSSGSTLSVQLSTGTGTDQTAGNMSIWTGLASPISISQTITTNWVRYSFTATLAANITQAGITLFYTPVGTAGADDNVYFTGVQLEIGSVATPFDFRPYGMELALCQRYYCFVPGGNGTGYATAGGQAAGFPVFWPVFMRTTPTVILVGSITSSNVTSENLYNTAFNGLKYEIISTAAGKYYVDGRILVASAEL